MGLLPRFSVTGLFGWDMLELPFKSISLGYKQEKTRSVREMTNSADLLVRNNPQRPEEKSNHGSRECHLQPETQRGDGCLGPELLWRSQPKPEPLAAP